MQELRGKVAVVTGGASGIGRAMGQRFGQEGMRVVLADVEQQALDRTVAELRSEGIEVIGVVTDVSRYDEVERLKNATIEAYQRVHVLCNNAGIGAGAEGPIWEHELNDWRWAFNVNVWGIIHGINAFVPVMVAQQEEGHIVNTSSGNGGITPITSTPQYAVTKSAVVTLTECLYGQLQDAGAPINASVLFPGPHMLRTGLWESYRNRPADLPKTKPRKTPYLKLSDWEKQMADAGLEIQYTPVEEVADRVVTAIRQKDFWILPPDERTDEQIRNRAESMLKRDNPAYLRRGAT